MNPAGAIWQNELSLEVLNHTPSREKRAGPEITRSLCQDSVCPAPVSSSDHVIVSASGKTHDGPKWRPQATAVSVGSSVGNFLPVAPALPGLICPPAQVRSWDPPARAMVNCRS